jgi:beta-N-acetylhexosaminidase
VAKHVAAFVAGLQGEGVVACAKHFPGHGDTATDSHRELPVVERPEPELRRTELPPFAAAVRAGVGAVMAAHVVFPEWDEDRPASLSDRVVPRVLRGDLGFGGVVISDDVKMRAVWPRWSPEELVRGATFATVDLVLVGDLLPLQLEVFEALVRAQEEDAAFEKATIRAVERVDALRDRFLANRAVSIPAAPGEHQRLADEIEERAR